MLPSVTPAMNARISASSSALASRFLRISWTGSTTSPRCESLEGTSLVALGFAVRLASHDRDRRARTDPIRAGLRHLHRILDGTYATRRLHAELRTDELPHELDVLDGRAALAK